ncbi:MAG: class I SAM-dependent methyltransferase [Calditrichaeota bacterium]|nr:MAG: class I SAM-dependent methyltransferase [Calditrichota bacterium]
MSKQHRAFFNQLAPVWQSNEEPERLLPLLREFGVQPSDYILDMGAGAGCISKWLITLCSQGRVVAADVSDKMLAQARLNLSNNFTDLICTDACDLGIKADFFDKIICYSVFPHINRPLRALHEFWRILKPSGKLLIFHNCCSRHLNQYHSQKKSIVSFDKLPKVEQLILMLKENGFEEVHGHEAPNLYWVEAVK